MGNSQERFRGSAKDLEERYAMRDRDHTAPIDEDGILLGKFALSMFKLAVEMSELERKRYKDEGLYEKLLQLQNECDENDMIGLKGVYDVFDGVHKGDDE